MKRSPKPGDMNQRMYAVVQEAAGLDDSPVKDQSAIERGRLGGIARAKSLTPARRVAIAKAARGARSLPKAAAVRKSATRTVTPKSASVQRKAATIQVKPKKG